MTHIESRTEGQAMKKAIALTGALLVALACSEQQQAPTGPQFAKGGKGKANVTLTEYWVTSDNVLHLAGTGPVASVAPYPSHDRWHNGYKDDDYSIHYEYSHLGAGWASVTRDGDTWSVDIPWNGERERDGTQFREFASTPGPDPFVFSFAYELDSGRRMGTPDPQGVIGTPPSGETSYALFQGLAPEGVVSISTLSLTDVTCEVVAGRGKRRPEHTVVSGRIQATAITSDNQIPENAWLEFHLVVGDGEAMNGTSHSIWQGGVDATISATFDGALTEVAVGLWLDYVMPLRDFADYDWDGVEEEVAAVTVFCN
jgi:hypothetical protein